MSIRRRHRERILLPGESEGRRSFLRYGLFGAALLAVGGGTFLATRRTRPAPDLGGPLTVLSPEEATVFAALAERILPPRPGFPSPQEVGLVPRIDALVALMPPEGRKEVRQLVGLFENALAGLLLDGQWRTFTGSPPEQQEARIRAWMRSRYTVRRTGYRALKKIVVSSYFGSPATWKAIGYPGPPTPGGAVQRAPARSGTITDGETGAPPREVRP